MFRPSLQNALLHPVRLLPISFLGLTIVGTILLLLPFAHSGDGSASLEAAIFQSTSAVTVTGLATVDTSTYWTPAGQAIILVLAEVGGLGIVALATVLGLFIGGRLGLRTSLVAQADMHVVSLGEVRPLFRRVTVTMVLFQLVIAAVLTVRYRLGYFDDLGTSAWHGVFDSVMSFNNAGFSLNSDSIVSYAGDAVVILSLSIGVFIGAMGFPVLAELFQGWRRPSLWTIHTRLTVWGSVLLFVVAALLFLVYEWQNTATIGDLSWSEKLITGVEASTMTRSGGLASFDWNSVKPESLNIATVLMFIGGGSASTAGGIKITTFLLLGFVILAELRGDPDVTVGRRSISAAVIRTALTIALLAVMLVIGATFTIMSMTDFEFDVVLFECASAFGTVGLSTGITPQLPVDAQMTLSALMFVGRVGTIAAASAFVLRRRTTRYHLPEEQPIIG